MNDYSLRIEHILLLIYHKNKTDDSNPETGILRKMEWLEYQRQVDNNVIQQTL